MHCGGVRGEGVRGVMFPGIPLIRVQDVEELGRSAETQ